jgi:hypothetical protein
LISSSYPAKTSILCPRLIINGILLNPNTFYSRIVLTLFFIFHSAIFVLNQQKHDTSYNLREIFCANFIFNVFPLILLVCLYLV